RAAAENSARAGHCLESRGRSAGREATAPGRERQATSPVAARVRPRVLIPACVSRSLELARARNAKPSFRPSLQARAGVLKDARQLIAVLDMLKATISMHPAQN